MNMRAKAQAFHAWDRPATSAYHPIMRDLMGAILAGGLSTRMGRDKSTLRLKADQGGERMLDRVASAMRTVCNDVVIVGSKSTIDVESSPRAMPFIVDLRPHAGPLGGIEALLASNLAREYLVCPCDVPCITPEALRLLLQHRDAPATVLRLKGEADFESLPARVSVAALPTVQRLLDADQRSVWRLMRELPAAIVEIDSHHAAALRNINTPEDLNTL